MKSIRIGSGAGFAGDRIEPAIDLIRDGDLDYIIFECLAERTISLAQQRRKLNPSAGYDELLEERFTRIFELFPDRKVKIITNMGAANPFAAALKCREIADRSGLCSLKIACVSGDEKTSEFDAYKELLIMETGKPLSSIDGEIYSVNGYLGAKGIVEALSAGADVVITGRVADSSLTLAPLIYEFGWSMDDYTLLGCGTAAGHLLECAGQLTGGYYADPGFKDVPELWNLGFPFADVSCDGSFTVSKLPYTGGLVSVDTVKEQLLYEVEDPSKYYAPDVIADFSNVQLKQIEENVVEINGITGGPPNGFFKTSVGFHDCYIGIGEISYGGSNCVNKARLACEIIERRLAHSGIKYEEIRFDYIGLNSLYGTCLSSGFDNTAVNEVRLRVAARTSCKKDAMRIGEEVESLYTNGPSGGGGAEKKLKNIVSIVSVLISAEDFNVKVDFF